MNKQNTNELVNHPQHYTSHPSNVECITIVQHHNFNIGNAMKYLWRCGLKDGEGEVKELLKAKKYIEFELERIGYVDEKVDIKLDTTQALNQINNFESELVKLLGTNQELNQAIKNYVVVIALDNNGNYNMPDDIIAIFKTDIYAKIWINKTFLNSECFITIKFSELQSWFMEKANLDLVTTKELIEEIQARCELNGTINYKTVDKT